MESSATPATPSLKTLGAREQTIKWIGGVIRPHGFRHRGKPMRIAAWIDRKGTVVGAAIVEGHGPTVLRELLEESLMQAEAGQRPSELVVWPNVRAAFRGLDYPKVLVEHDSFLTLVIEDEADAGFIPGGLPVRVGCPQR